MPRTALHTNDDRATRQCVWQCTKPRNGDRSKGARFFWWNLSAIDGAAVNRSTAPIAAIQHAPQIDIRLLRLGVAEYGVDLIVENRRLAPTDESHDDGGRRADR